MKWPNELPTDEQAGPPALSAGNTGAAGAERALDGRGNLAFLPSGWRQGWLFGLFLVVVTIIAYHPAWHAGFIWDDDDYVTKNALLTAPDGLRRIWFSLDSPSQYFPLTYTTFYLEHALWGFNPAGYHLVNLLLHAANVLLVWQLLARLRVPGAWLAAAVFALHPVQVESVAWITERKNVLMGFFFLLTLWAWIKFTEGQSKRPWRFYLLALIFYALALFAKTTACTLPAALLLILWLRKMPIHWRRLGQVAPFVAMGIGMGLVTVWWERHHQGTQGKLFAIGPVERVLIASRALWFYAGKLLWPSNLTFSYPRWTISASEPLAYGWLLATAALGVVVWRARRWAGRSIEVAAVYFAATLSPVLGFIMLYTFVYSFVADHYQYLACIGPIALAAAGMQIGLGRIAAGKPFLWPVLCAAMLMTLGALTWKQCGMYANAETLWQATIRLNPDSWMSHYNLGTILGEQGLVDGAITQYQEALQLKPDHEHAHINLGIALLQKGNVDEAILHYQKALEINPNGWKTHNNLGNALLQKGRVDEAIGHYQRALELKPEDEEAHYNLGNALLQKGGVAEAISQYQKALEINPDNAKAHYHLGNVFAQQGRLDEAITHYQKALQVDPNSAPAHYSLANVLRRKGQVDEAIAQYELSLQMDPNSAPARYNLGNLLLKKGRTEEAIAQYQQALQTDPGYAEAHVNLGLALVQQGRADEAIPHLQEAVRIKPDYAAAHINLGSVLLQRGNIAEAIAHYQKALQLDPANPTMQNNLAWLLATCAEGSLRDGKKAVELARQANDLTKGENPVVLHTLAAAYAEAGRFGEAVETAQRALQLAGAQSNTNLAGQLQLELKLYQAGNPYHLPAQAH